MAKSIGLCFLTTLPVSRRLRLFVSTRMHEMWMPGIGSIKSAIDASLNEPILAIRQFGYGLVAFCSILICPLQAAAKESPGIIDAVYRGDIEGVKAALKNGHEINGTYGLENMTPLLWAVEQNNLDMAQWLIRNGAKVNSWDPQIPSPIHRAGDRRFAHMVKLLLDNGAKVGFNDKYKMSVLLYVSAMELAEDQKLPLIQTLVKRGDNVNYHLSGGNTALIMAAGQGHLKIVKFLLSKGALVNEPGKGGITPVSIAANHNHVEIIKWLLKQGADPNIRSSGDMMNALMYAAAGKADDAITLLIDRVRDINVKSQDGASALAFYVKQFKANPNIISLFAKKGANLSANPSLLDRAASTKNVEAVRTLVKLGAPKDGTDSSGATPLHSASRTGCLECVLILIDAGIDVNATNDRDLTALDLCDEQYNPELCDLLVSKGSRPRKGGEE